MTREDAQLIARLFQRIQAQGAEIRRKRLEHPGRTDTFLEVYEGWLINALLLMQTQAQVFGFALEPLGMAALDRKQKRWFDSVFEPMPLTDPPSPDQDEALYSPAVYLQIVRNFLREHAQGARESVAQGRDAVRAKAHAQAFDDILAWLDEERVREGLDEQFGRRERNDG